MNESQDESPIFKTIGKAAQRLGVHEQKVRELIRNGELPSRKIGRRVYVPTIAVEQFAGVASASEPPPKRTRIRAIREITKK